MPDPRISKLAKVLVHYSVELQKGQQVLIRTNELTLAVYEEIVKAGAHPFIANEVPGIAEFVYGGGYPESGSKNESGLHWDTLCDVSDAEINMDGNLFYKNGRTLIP